MVMHTADMIIDLQWPSTMDVSSQSNRLWENFLACFDYFEFYDDSFTNLDRPTWALREIRSGMEDRAAQLGCAFHSLACLNQTPSPKPQIEVWFTRAHLDTYHSDLQNVLHSFDSIGLLILNPSPILKHPVNMQWILHIIPYILRDHNQASKISYLKHLLVQLDHSAPKLDRTGFSDYLFCVYACLLDGDVNNRDLVCMDKR
jgi:hypothetical protein